MFQTLALALALPLAFNIRSTVQVSSAEKQKQKCFTYRIELIFIGYIYRLDKIVRKILGFF